MRTTRRLFVFVVVPLLWLPAVLAQTDPPPADPHEMVTRQPRILSKPADRADALDLLARARKNLDLHSIEVPYRLNVSFESQGATRFEGAGTMEEVYDGQSNWRWTEQLQDSHIIRIGADGRVYGENPSEPVPLRVQQVRSVVLRPIVFNAAQFLIRAAEVNRNGKRITCLLLSHSLPPNPAPRAWVEREDCIDPATGLLQSWSEAPGIYATYDYTGPDFHGHAFPRHIAIFEEGRLTVKVEVTSLEDAPNLDPDLFKPTQQMADAGEAFGLSSASRQGPLRVDPSDAPTSRFFQPVIVHAILNAQDGSVLDAEALQNSSDDLGRAALDIVKSTSFDPTGFQEEVFVNVQFHLPASRFGGQPIFHPRVHWVLLDRRVSVPPVRNPQRGK